MADITIGQHIFKDSFMHDLMDSELNYTTTFSSDFKLSFVAVQRDGSGAAVDIEIYFDSSDGALYDALLATISPGMAGSAVYIPDGDIYFKDGDEIRLAATQTGGSNDLNITIHVVQE